MQRSQLWWLECCESELPAEESWLSHEETTCFRERWVPKRRHDWLLGRWTAKCALAEYFGAGLNPEFLSTFSILPVESGAPVAFINREPVGVSLSISHRDGRALAAIGSGRILVGCDLEKAEPHSSTFLQQFFTTAEIDQVEHSTSMDPATTETLIWSAKEAVLKMLSVGLRVDTRCVSVSIDVAPTNIEAWRRFSAMLVDGRQVSGWWCREGTWLRTLAASAPTTPVLLMPSQRRTDPLSNVQGCHR